MKSLFTYLVLLISVSAFSQKTIPTKEGKIFYEDITSLDSSSNKSKLYLQARQWLSSLYNNSKNVIEIEDKESGKLLGKGLIDYSLESGFKKAYVKFSINIDVRDGKYRIQLFDFSIKRSKRDFNGIDNYYAVNLDEDFAKYKEGKTKKADSRVFEGLDDYAVSLISDFKKAMSVSASDNF